MTQIDWYQSLFGSPAPGRRARTPASRYLDDPRSAPEVGRVDALAESMIRREDDGRVTGLPAPAAPVRGPRIFTPENVGNAARDVAGYVGDYVRDGVPRDDYRPPSPAAQTPRVRDTEGLDDPSADPPVGARTPFSVATGATVEPFGEDFAAWYEATRGRPLPAALRADAAPTEQAERFEWGLNTETGSGAEAAPRPLDDKRRGLSPDDAAPGFDASRQAGIVPMPDATQDWIAAERRAFERAREGRPTIYDMMFAAVFGNRPGRERQP